MLKLNVSGNITVVLEYMYIKLLKFLHFFKSIKLLCAEMNLTSTKCMSRALQIKLSSSFSDDEIKNSFKHILV